MYSEKHITDIASHYQTLDKRCDTLLTAYMLHNFQNERAKEFAHQGFLRRLNIIKRCVTNVFQLLPPENSTPPSKEVVNDATINLQSFIINLYACVDNLAWILVHECQIKKDDGNDIPNKWVGLRKSNTFLRGKLSNEFQTLLKSFDPWFEYLESYRHSLVHRIPLYIPPYVVMGENNAKYQELNAQKNTAINARDYDGYNTLSEEQDALGVFSPIITHSFSEESRPVWFHPQMLTDFGTIEEIAKFALKELSA